MVTIASRGGKRFRVFNEVALTVRVCVQKPIILPFLYCSGLQIICGDVLLLFSLLRRMSLPPAKIFNSFPDHFWNPSPDSLRSGQEAQVTKCPTYIVRLLAVSPSLAVKKTPLQVNMLWLPTKQKIDSFRGPKHLMWVTTTCSTGRCEGQAGCDWQSDAPPLSFISNLSNSWNTGSISLQAIAN